MHLLRSPQIGRRAGDEAADGDRCAWRSSIVIGVVFAAVAMLYSFELDAWLHHQSFWMAPMDAWMTVDGGRMIWNGALGYVYQGTGSYALPLSFIVMAPASGLIDHLHLVEGSPYPVQYSTAWLVAGPYGLLFGIVLLHAVRRLAWDLGARRRLWLMQALSAALVLAPAYLWGHFEDVLALAFVLHALRCALRSDFVRAALFLSVAISFKQWAFMLIPFLVFSAPAGRRLRTFLAAGALPGAFILFFLAVDWSDASKALFSPVNLVSHFQGHSAFYATWLGSKTSQYSRTLGLLLAAPLGWTFRRVRRPEHVLAAAGAILVIRPFSEAINYSYYFSPFLLTAVLVGVIVHRRLRWQDWIWPVGAMAWATPRGNSATMTLWWVGEMILLGATTTQLLANCGVHFGRLRKGLLPVKNTASAPISNAMSLARAAGETLWTQ